MKRYDKIDSNRLLLICDKPEYYMPLNYNYLTFISAKKQKEAIKVYHRNYYNQVITFQRIIHPFTSSSIATRLDPDFELRTVGTIKLPRSKLIVSELVSIK